MAILYPPIEVIKKRKPEATNGERALLSFLLHNYNDEYEIFFQPFLNGDLPDIVLMHKGGGIMVFEVKDWDLTNYHVDEQGRWIVNANKAIYRNNPLQQVLKYKKNLYDLHIDSLLELHLKDFKYWYVVNCAVYFHCSTTQYAQNHCNGVSPTSKYKKFLEKNFTIIGYDSLNVDYFNKIFQERWISYNRSKYFTEALYKSFTRILRPSYHTIEEGLNQNLSTTQQELSISENGARKRIKGVAGSGKTLVLALRAVNAYKRTGKPILILTFNITLKNYIHDKISAVRENFAWEFFHISNYHDFINSNMNNVGIGFDSLQNNEEENVNCSHYIFETEIEEKVYSNIHLFDEHQNELPKYSTILIDETQDYKENWIRIIKDNFAESNAEIVVFADEKQNIYSRDLDNENKMPVIPIQTGAWDQKLNKSYRLSKKLALLASDFQKRFFHQKYNIESSIETDTMLSLFEEPHIEYHYFPAENDIDIVNYLYKQIEDNSFNSNDITILSSRIRMLRELDYLLRTQKKENTNIMFESKEEFQFLNSKLNSEVEFNKKIRTIRKYRKNNFWMNRGTIKLSTIHSFKGWESPVLFLVIENNLGTTDKLYENQTSKRLKPSQFCDELVYTGLTRCRNFLFIINIDNANYHEYFTSNIFIDKKIIL